MVGDEVQYFGQFTLAFGGFFKIAVQPRLIGCLQGIGNGLLGGIFLVLDESRRVVGVTSNGPTFLVQNVLHVGFLAKEGVEVLYLLTERLLLVF